MGAAAACFHPTPRDSTTLAASREPFAATAPLVASLLARVPPAEGALSVAVVLMAASIEPAVQAAESAHAAESAALADDEPEGACRAVTAFGGAATLTSTGGSTHR